MQKHTFEGGGFVIHKIRLESYAGRFSAWFDAKGDLVDAEQIDVLDRSRRVTTKQAEHLRVIGRIWAD